MGALRFQDRTVECQWATDVHFDGRRLEVLSGDGNILFDVSSPEEGEITVNTFGKEVSAGLIEAAIGFARKPG